MDSQLRQFRSGRLLNLALWRYWLLGFLLRLKQHEPIGLAAEDVVHLLLLQLYVVFLNDLLRGTPLDHVYDQGKHYKDQNEAGNFLDILGRKLIELVAVPVAQD